MNTFRCKCRKFKLHQIATKRHMEAMKVKYPNPADLEKVIEISLDELRTTGRVTK